MILPTIDELSEDEPPSSVSGDGASMYVVERVMAISHLPADAHVAVIGHHTLPFILALLRRGCTAVRSLRPGAPAPDCEPTDLAWIVDLRNEHELDDAFHAARGRVGERGRIILEGAMCSWRNALAGLRDHALAAGLDIISVDHHMRRVVLAPTRRQAMAA